MPRRARFAVLILPYSVELDGQVSYAVFRGPGLRRAWHVLVGDGVYGETPREAAGREAWRIADMPLDAEYLPLDTRAPGARVDHAFAVRVCLDEVRPRRQHLEYDWVSYRVAEGLLHDQVQRGALRELHRRLSSPAPCR